MQLWSYYQATATATAWRAPAENENQRTATGTFYQQLRRPATTNTITITSTKLRMSKTYDRIRLRPAEAECGCATTTGARVVEYDTAAAITNLRIHRAQLSVCMCIVKCVLVLIMKCMATSYDCTIYIQYKSYVRTNYVHGARRETYV